MLGKQIIELDNYEKCWIRWLIKPYREIAIKYLVKKRYGKDGKYEYVEICLKTYFERCLLMGDVVRTALFPSGKYFKNMEVNKYYTPVEAGLYYES